MDLCQVFDQELEALGIGMFLPFSNPFCILWMQFYNH